jgi:hypothetical protein
MAKLLQASPTLGLLLKTVFNPLATSVLLWQQTVKCVCVCVCVCNIKNQRKTSVIVLV